MKPFTISFRLLLLFSCLLSTIQVEGQLKRWSVPQDLITFHLGPAFSILLPGTTLPLQSVSNSIYDKTGNLLFFVIDNEIYNHNGSIIDNFYRGTNLLQGDRFGQEMSIVPVPGSCTKYYIIFSYLSDDGVAWIPYYAEIDFAFPSFQNPSVQGLLKVFGPGTNVYNLASIAPPIAFDDPAGPSTEQNRFGLAVTPFRSQTSDHFLIMKGFDSSKLFRYVINASGIFFDSGNPNDLGIINFGANPALQDGDNDSYPEMELVISNGKYRVANVYDGARLVIAELNLSDGTLIPGSVRTATLPIVAGTRYQVRGVEFSPSGDYIYYSYIKAVTGVGTTEHLGYLDLVPSTLSTVEMLNANFPGANTLGQSFIEMGFDGKLHYTDATSLVSLASPNSGPSTGSWSTTVNFIGTLPILPDQIDGQDYDLIIETCDTCCTNEMAFIAAAQLVESNGALGDCFISVVGTGLNDCMVIEWDFGDGVGSQFGAFPNNTQVNYTYSATGTYNVCYTVKEVNAVGDTCWEYEQCEDIFIICESCCMDSLAFITAAQNVQASAQLGELCDISYTTDGLTECTEITFNWGDGKSSGPFIGGSASVTHSYTSGGVYNLCYTVHELNNIDTCWSYTHCDSIQIVCDTCFCTTPSFSNLYIRGPGGPSIAIQCETSYENIGCPDPGKGFTLTGLFECTGDSCDTQPYVYWDLIGPLGGSVASGSTPGPYFGVNLWPAYFAQPGIYTMKLTGFCNFDTCTCEFQFVVDCPSQCPCDLKDIQAFAVAVNQGFAQILYPNSCKACFSPGALSDCETVDWYLNSTGGTPIGSSLGSNSFCYLFPGSGTYNVIMVVNRKKPDGTDCETFTKSQTVKIFCQSLSGCNNSVFENSGFDEDAEVGGLNSGGFSSGWVGSFGDPIIVNEEEGSLDGWSVDLSGNMEEYDVLTSESAICLNKDTVVFMLRGIINTSRSNIKSPSPCDRIVASMNNGSPILPDICPDDQCIKIASIDLGPLYPTELTDTSEWFEVEVTFDLRDWMTVDSCTGITNSLMVRPTIYVTNGLSNDQGPETRTYIQIDNFCVEGETVAVEEITQKQEIKVFPNPTNGVLRLELPFLSYDDISLQITSLTGQQILGKKAELGNAFQTMDATTLHQGMYFIQILSKGQVIAVNKFVKQ